MNENEIKSMINIHTASQHVISGSNARVYFRFMLKRFCKDSQSYVDYSYAIEWANRFNSNPTNHMDSESKTILSESIKDVEDEQK